MSQANMSPYYLTSLGGQAATQSPLVGGAPQQAPIQGQLQMSNAGAGLYSGLGGMVNNPAGALASIGSNYAGAYNAALSANQQNYSNVLAGYQQTMQAQQAAQAPIQQGYSNLYGTVMGGIQGIGASQAQAIQDVYHQQQGSAQQQLMNSGLGNTTVLSSVNRGLGLDEAKAQTALANQLAQLQAGYQSQLGQSGLNYQNQAAMQNTALASQQLQAMQGVNIPYPSAAAYGSLAAGALGLQAAQAGRGVPPGPGMGAIGPHAAQPQGGGNLGGMSTPGTGAMPTTPPGYQMPGSVAYPGTKDPNAPGVTQNLGQYPLDPNDPYYQSPAGQLPQNTSGEVVNEPDQSLDTTGLSAEDIPDFSDY